MEVSRGCHQKVGPREWAQQTLWDSAIQLRCSKHPPPGTKLPLDGGHDARIGMGHQGWSSNQRTEDGFEGSHSACRCRDKPLSWGVGNPVPSRVWCLISLCGLGPVTSPSAGLSSHACHIWKSLRMWKVFGGTFRGSWDPASLSPPELGEKAGSSGWWVVMTVACRRPSVGDRVVWRSHHRSGSG